MSARRRPSSAAKKRASSAADWLVEIGTEEMPAAYLTGTLEQLRQEAERICADAHLEHGAVETAGTPRRLMLRVADMAPVQRNPAEEIRGPSKQASFDATGQPTEALKGFLRGRGGALSQTKTVSTDKGDYVYLVKPERLSPTKQVLPELVVQLINRLRFPKTMRWDASGLRFARPIRWLVVFYGTQSLRVSLGTIRSGTHTRVGRPQRLRTMSIVGASMYEPTLVKQGIILDLSKRRARIQALITKLAREQGGVVAPEMVDHGLLDEVTALVEQPIAIGGTFDQRYLQLPREVLLASMAKHQRVFAVQDGAGRLLARFVAILDGKPGKPALVRNVIEHILNARLADSMLFLEQDLKQPFAEGKNLAGVTFHEKLGSMADKTQRQQQLAAPLADAWRLTDAERSRLNRAVLLAKHDLVTTMVREFPTLQGIVGKHYALRSGEPREVAEALAEQYLPAAGKRPSTLIGNALALLDKYDTMTSYFGIGIEPTGDQDPFGLRRAAQGIVEIIGGVRRALPLSPLFAARKASAPFAAMPAEQSARTEARIRMYLFERLYTFDWPVPAPSRDLIDAVLASRPDDLFDAIERIQALHALGDGPALLRAAKVVERTHNILKSAKSPAIEPDQAKLQEAPERKLWELYTAHREPLADLIGRRSYQDATARYGEVFFAPLNDFFDQVMVNVPDEALRQNRLALMRAINTLYTVPVADLSKLTILQQSASSA